MPNDLTRLERAFCDNIRRGDDPEAAFRKVSKTKNTRDIRKAVKRLMDLQRVKDYLTAKPAVLETDRQRLELIRDAHLEVVADKSASPQERAASARAASAAMKDLAGLRDDAMTADVSEELLAFLAEIKREVPDLSRKTA